MLALELLRCAAGSSRPTADGRLFSLLRDAPERELQWLI